jgi:predicted O-methyltransferase YrrM
MKELKEIVSNLESNLQDGLISPRIILSSLRFIDESSRKSGAYADPLYMPFYYHLGKHISPKSYIQIGFNLGLSSACFMKSCNSVEDFLAFQRKNEVFYSSRLSIKNVKNHYKNNFSFYHGGFHDEAFEKSVHSKKWDLIMVNERILYDTHLECLEILWPFLSSGGFLVVDRVVSDKSAKDSFSNFCNIKNRDPFVIKTRYGVGIVQK